MARYRVVANYLNDYVTHWHIERKGWLWWSKYGDMEYDIQEAKSWCDSLNNPRPKSASSTKVVHPYDETPAGKAHR